MTTPQRIGAYPIERELGRGGMGIVYLGRDPRLDRLVAIKVLPELFARDPERLARFEREARLLASLNHPNIAGIYGIEEADGHRFLALEYVEGETLGERLTRGPMAVDEALEIGRQIAAALEAAHEAGIVHRDLKPGNVKLTSAGEIKVLDFGLAKGGAESPDSNSDLSRSPTMAIGTTGIGVILGTAAYMSPEQARGKSVDRRTDIWSFGCVLYECLTRRQLFTGETISDMIARILEREPDWDALPAALPEKVRELLRRCLEKDAKRRLRDIGDARLELEEALAARTSASRVTAAEKERAATSRRDAGGRRVLVAYAVALAGLVVATVAILGPMVRTEPPRAVRLSVTEPEGATMNGDAVDCALSPDGRAVAFVGSDSLGNLQLWVRRLESLEARPLPGTDNASRPFWSSDSRSIGFFAEGKLRKVRLGGSVESVCDASNGRGGTWSPNGTIVFAPAGDGPLFAVSAAGGQPRPVTALDSTRHDTAHRFPSFLPDGRHFLYAALPGGARGFPMMVGSLDGGRDRLIGDADSAPVYAAPGYLLYARDRNLVAQRFDPGSLRTRGEPVPLPDTPAGSNFTGAFVATTSRNGSLAYMNGSVTNNRLAWLDRSGRVVGMVPVPAAQYQIPILSPDERTLAIDRFNNANEADIWLVDLARGIRTRFTFGPRQNLNGIWSPDGSRIAFESDRNGTYDIYVKPANGAMPEKLLVGGRSQFHHPTSWTPDGRSLVFYQMDAGTGFDIYTVPADGSGPPVPYLQSPFHETFPLLSPDGHWMLYVSDESGRPELYVQSFPTPGNKSQITTGGCQIGIWRRDGREIVVEGLDGQTFSSVEVEESVSSFRSSPPRLLFRGSPNAIPGFAISRDGQRFLMPVPEGRPISFSITVVLDWKAGLAAQSGDRR